MLYLLINQKGKHIITYMANFKISLYFQIKKKISLEASIRFPCVQVQRGGVLQTREGNLGDEIYKKGKKVWPLNFKENNFTFNVFTSN